jgi:hypothetical protein
MTAVTALAVQDAGSWSPADQLPPNVSTLKLVLGGVQDKNSRSHAATNNKTRSISLQPVLDLGHLQTLHLDMMCADVAVPTAEETEQLSTLRSLQEVRIVWDAVREV